MYYGEVAEWLKASDCKSLQSLVRIQSSPPVFRASVTVAQQTPNLLDGVQFPGSEPSYTLVDKQVKSLLQEGRIWRFESSPGYQIDKFYQL